MSAADIATQMADARAQLLQNFTDRIHARRSRRKCLCRCPTCEREVPLYQRDNEVSLTTAGNHKRRHNGLGTAFYSSEEVIASYRAALGLDLAVELMRQAQDSGDSEHEGDRGSEPEGMPSDNETDPGPDQHQQNWEPNANGGFSALVLRSSQRKDLFLSLHQLTGLRIAAAWS